jgi:GNAT superfamily N-acetyltransferase
MIEVGGYRPGCLADIVACHARYYAENWGFGLAFEAKVAGELAAFATRMNPEDDLLLVAHEGERFAGSIVIDADSRGAHLRWFIVAEPGHGLGRRLIQSALAFCDERHYATVWLTTFSGLDAARRLYEEHGFKLIEESAIDQWQGGVREQLFERRLAGSPQ